MKQASTLWTNPNDLQDTLLEHLSNCLAVVLTKTHINKANCQ